MGSRGVGVVVLAAIPAAGLASACSSIDALPSVEAESPGACATYVPPSTFSPTSPLVSFSADVMPLITRSCGDASCHGAEIGPTGGMYLGSNEELTFTSVVGVASNDVPTMARVQPGDPATSFLQHKIDGDACTLTACSRSTCSESMPQGQDLMAVTDRLTIRAWIAQGALSDLAGFDAGGL